METLAYYKADPSPDITKTIPQRLLLRAEDIPTKDAYILRVPGQPRKVISFGDLASSSMAVGRDLIALKLEKGERVGIIGPNCPGYLFSYYGALLAGLVVLHFRIALLESAEELKRLINKHKMVALIVHPEERSEMKSMLCEMLQKKQVLTNSIEHLSCPSTPGLRNIISMIPRTDSVGPSPADSDITSQTDALLDRVRRSDPFDMLEAYFSTGSTGPPKLVARSHYSMIQALLLKGLSAEMKCWNNRLFPWVGSIFSVAVIIGCTLVNSPLDMKMPDILQILTEESINVAHIPPFMLYDLVEYHEKNTNVERLSDLKLAMTGGERVSSDLILKGLNYLPAIALVYGCTESGQVAGSLTARRSEDLTKDKNTSDTTAISPESMRVVRNYEVKIVNNNNEIVSRNVIGELLVRSPNLFIGYLDDDELTAKAVDGEGWFRTGDIGRMLDDNLLTIEGRTKTIISRGTAMIYPAVVERIVMELPQVSQVCVVGIPHDRLFEESCACVVLASPASLTSNDIYELCRERCALMVDNMPDHVICFDEFPTNANGKVDRALLKQKAMEQLGDLK